MSLIKLQIPAQQGLRPGPGGARDAGVRVSFSEGTRVSLNTAHCQQLKAWHSLAGAQERVLFFFSGKTPKQSQLDNADLAASAAGSMSLERKRSSPGRQHAGVKPLQQGCVSISPKALPPFPPPAATA